MKKKFPRTAILIFPFASGALYSWAVKPATLVSSVVKNTVIVGGGIPTEIKWPEDIKVVDIRIRLHYLRQVKPIVWSIILWVTKAVTAQFLFAYQVFKLRNEIDAVYCLMGMYYQLPILMARILGKKVISASMGVYSLQAKINYGPIIGAIIYLLTRFNFALSDLITVESLLLGDYSDLRLHKEKLMNGALYLQEPDKFDIEVKLLDRKPIVAFVGRLVKEKGILKFLQAIPMIVSKNPNVKILIVGTGILDAVVGKMVADMGWSDKVTWVKWIEPHKMPELLNQIKLLVVPSYEEGLPNIILEAMGCGTPVLASRAGGIPDIVKEGCTGSVLSNIAADTIAHEVDRVINSPCLEILTFNAKELIKQEYSLDASITRYEKIIEKVGDRHKA